MEVELNDDERKAIVSLATQQAALRLSHAVYAEIRKEVARIVREQFAPQIQAQVTATLTDDYVRGLALQACMPTTKGGEPPALTMIYERIDSCIERWVQEAFDAVVDEVRRAVVRRMAGGQTTQAGGPDGSPTST